MVLKEIADLGFVIAFRFYGRYPETGPRFYHPPCCESDRVDAEVAVAAAAAVAALPASENGRRCAPVRRAPLRRPGLATATSLILPSLSAPDLSEFFANATLQSFGQFDLDGVELPSPAPQSVGAH
ncbi:hypothetical protein M758_4G258700 [Ceratodon purpureus]|uniref:Uncharacterized protein n=1 Tax=Ceratodon purpureus TaxID=3225 RepID=A0A8T0ICP4_CERPU|nr:hypothetical protein KC19_4G258300 [Ceratodon purpureus]KAG0620971.1 hypothetical protein M758_4G258700 [Ceratodon purpureus]